MRNSDWGEMTTRFKNKEDQTSYWLWIHAKHQQPKICGYEFQVHIF